MYFSGSSRLQASYSTCCLILDSLLCGICKNKFPRPLFIPSKYLFMFDGCGFQSLCSLIFFKPNTTAITVRLERRKEERAAPRSAPTLKCFSGPGGPHWPHWVRFPLVTRSTGPRRDAGPSGTFQAVWASVPFPVGVSVCCDTGQKP